jgi:hypothetical protein
VVAPEPWIKMDGELPVLPALATGTAAVAVALQHLEP